MFNNYWTNFKVHARKEKVRTPAGKLKVSLISILIGIMFGLLIVSMLGSNPFTFLFQLLTLSFENSAKFNQFMIFGAVFIMAGLANAFAFKTGLFNIGVSGQMLAGGGVAMVLSLTVLKGVDKAIAIPILIIVAASVAAIVGLFVGFLKVRFNVNEVVSTILFNWIIYFIMKYLFMTSRSYVTPFGDSKLSKHTLGSGLVTETGWPIAIIIALVSVAVIYVILRFTVFGKSLKMTGINNDASEYSGINVKKSMVLSLTISAALAGILGFVFYFATKGFMPAFLVTSLPSIGFDGIALALLAFSSPIGMIPVGMMYALFKVSGFGITAIDPSYKNEMISLIFSIMIYSAAISSVFYRFRPIKFLYSIYLSSKSDKVKIWKKERKEKIAKLLKVKNDGKILHKDEFKKQKLLFKEELNAVKKEYKNKISEENSRTIEENLKLDYSISKSNVKNILNEKYKKKRSFESMSFNTKIKNLNSDKTLLIENKKELRDIKKNKINRKFSYQTKINEERKDKFIKLKIKHSIAMKQIDNKESKNENILFRKRKKKLKAIFNTKIKDMKIKEAIENKIKIENRKINIAKIKNQNISLKKKISKEKKKYKKEMNILKFEFKENISNLKKQEKIETNQKTSKFVEMKKTTPKKLTQKEKQIFSKKINMMILKGGK